MSISELDSMIDTALVNAEVDADQPGMTSQNWSRLVTALVAVRTARHQHPPK